MTQEQIKQAVEEYFNDMFAKDADYLDHVTDSWIDDAEDWFVTYWYERHGDVTFKEGCEFRQHARKRFDELYDERYGGRDAKLHLYYIIGEVFNLKGEFEKYKHHFKTFPTYDNVVSTDFANLLEHLQLLSDIENRKIESLKEK